MKKQKLDQNELECFIMDGALRGDRFLNIIRIKGEKYKNLYNFLTRLV